jgi:hypothetical protein
MNNDKVKSYLYGSSVKGGNNDKEVNQDAMSIKRLDPHTSIAIVCDGAGFSKISHLASSFVAKQMTKELSYFATHKIKNEVSNHDVWRDYILKAVSRVQIKLAKYSSDIGETFSEMACTVIAILQSNDQLYTMHIGDGRGAFKTKSQWKAFMAPFNGEFSNETVFINSCNFSLQNNQDDFIYTTVETEVTGFAILTDGFENYCYSTSPIASKAGNYKDENKPYEPFFNGLFDQILTMKRKGIRYNQINKILSEYIDHGSPQIKAEQDDKSFIIGIIKKAK